VKEREPVAPEEVCAGFLSIADANGDARALVEKLVGDDPRFAWEDGTLRWWTSSLPSSTPGAR
jgi:hypothetical protein